MKDERVYLLLDICLESFIKNCIMKIAQKIREELQALANPENEPIMKKFFKAFPGGYGGEDSFLSVKIPLQRQITKKFYKDISLEGLSSLLKTKIHEYRITALMCLVLKYQKSKDPLLKKEYAEFYLNHLDWVNNWDLVDCSAPYLLGDYLLDKDPQILYTLADSGELWKERVAVLSGFAFIKKGRFELSLRLTEKLVYHQHDLIHKAVGWMLREIGNRDLQSEIDFLNRYADTLPRTMLRYAIEKFPEEKRQFYLKYQNRD